MGEWVAIEGYRWPYRINRKGCVQKQMEDGSWYTLKPYTSGRSRVAVKLRSIDNRKIDVPLVWLMADAFMGGRRPGYGIVHRNGAKFDCEPENLKFVPASGERAQRAQSVPAGGARNDRGGLPSILL